MFILPIVATRCRLRVTLLHVSLPLKQLAKITGGPSA
jgi:hypothetical protein